MVLDVLLDAIQGVVKFGANCCYNRSLKEINRLNLPVQDILSN